MKLLSLRAALLIPLSFGLFGACATAEDTGPSASSDAGSGSTGGVFGGGGAPSATAGATTFAGSPATAGRGGAGGAIGAAGSSGKGGASGGGGGAAGNGGGGAPPAFQPGDCATGPTIALQYQQGSTSQKQITGQFLLSNSSDTPAPLGSLRIRYFFTNEETSGWNSAVYSAQLDGGTGGYRKIDGTKLGIVPLGQAVEGADSFIELTFPAGLSMEKGATAKINWDMQPVSYNPPDQDQTNDYSYNAAATTPIAWDHVVVYVGDTLAWGCTPKSAGGSGGGAGDSGSSDAGAAGSTASAGSAGAAP